MAGREILIKSVIQAIPSHVMSCFELPKGMCHDIDAMISRFFWGGNIDKRLMHWLSWDKMARPTSDGALDFRRIVDFNKALLAKQWWRHSCNPYSLAFKVMKAKESGCQKC